MGASGLLSPRASALDMPLGLLPPLGAGGVVPRSRCSRVRAWWWCGGSAMTVPSIGTKTIHLIT